jgi:PAS domain S-box-containing protein
MGVAALRAPALRDGVPTALAELRERGHLIVETLHQRSDGTTFPVEVSSRRLEAGGEAAVVAIVRDISASRQAEESFRRLFENNPFPTWIFDVETLRFLEVNAAAIALYGWSRSEFLAMTIGDIRPPEELVALEQRMALLRAQPGAAAGGRWRHRRKDGSGLEVEISSYGHLFDGRTARVVTVHDVTARARVERDLRKLTRAVEQSSASVVITDLDGNIEYVNPKFCALTGYSREEALGRNPRILKSGVTPDATYRDMWSTLAAGGVWQGELCNRRKDGSLFWEEASISPLVDSDGRVTHYVAVKEDVTERRRLASELEQAQRLEAIGRLAGGVAHDINNILAVIGGITDLVLDELPAEAPRRADLLEVRAAVERGAGLTSKLLAFGRRRPAELRAVDLGSLVRGVASMLARLLGEQIELALDLPERIGAVRADPTGLEQVLVNLAVNARDAMPDGGRLSIALAERRIEAGGSGATGGSGALRDIALGDFVELTVSDTGSGIPEAIREHLFEPFVTTKGMGRGTGLGLAVVHGVITQASGSIRVESEPGRGTTFRILLPRSPEPAPAHPVEIARPPAVQTGETVLIAEDDRAVRALVERMLRGGGYRVLSAANGEEALRLLTEERGPVALLVTDVGMPGMSGNQLAERVRAARPGTPVLLISGHLAEPEPDAAARGESFLAKPFEASTLLAAARDAIAAAARRST